MISITQLEYILAVDQFKHFAKAAMHCHVSQPSLSIQIQKVEDELGYLIFDREKKPIEATAKGTLFINQARVVYAEHQKLLYEAKAEKGTVRGTFELGIIPTVMPFLVPFFISQFAQKYPLVNLSLRELTTAQCLQELHLGSLDGAILAGPLKERGIRELPLYYENFFLYAHPSSALLKKEKVHASDIDSKDLWLLMDGHCFKNQVMAFCAIDVAPERLRNVKLLGGSIETLRQVVNATWGYTLVPQMMIETLPAKEMTRQVRPFVAPSPMREISLAVTREQWKSDIIEALTGSISAGLPNSIPRKATKRNLLLDVAGEKQAFSSIEDRKPVHKESKP